MKIKQSKVVEISRTSIKFAAYNPRKKSDEVVKSLINNFKKIGYLGGIVYNKKTGNLVSGHKRVEALDKINKYTGKNDYMLRVEQIEVTDKVEKEQNIYMNNIEQQGEFDFELLADLAPDIDFDAAGLTDFQLDKISVFAPVKEPEIEEKQPEPEELTQEEKDKRKASVKDAKAKAVEKAYDEQDNATNSHLTIVFNKWDEKVEFCEMFGIDIDAKMIASKDFINKLE